MDKTKIKIITRCIIILSCALLSFGWYCLHHLDLSTDEFGDAKTFFDERSEFYDTLVAIGRDGGFYVNINCDYTDILNEAKMDFVYDEDDDTAFMDYKLSFDDGCVGYASFSYIDSPRFFFQIRKEYESLGENDCHMDTHMDEILAINETFMQYPVKLKNMDYLLYSEKYDKGTRTEPDYEVLVYHQYSPRAFQDYSYKILKWTEKGYEEIISFVGACKRINENGVRRK